VLVVLSVVATLSFAASSASAHGPRLGAVNTSELVAGAALRLNVTTARLTTAITNAAVARIDEAVREEEVDADNADELKLPGYKSFGLGGRGFGFGRSGRG
jgi:hypothetical protein